MRVRPAESFIADPACGIGGFLGCSAHHYLATQYNADKVARIQHHLRDTTRSCAGPELVDKRVKAPVRDGSVAARHRPATTDRPRGRRSPAASPTLLQRAVYHPRRCGANEPHSGKKSSITVVADEGDTRQRIHHLQPPGLLDDDVKQQLNFVQQHQPDAEDPTAAPPWPSVPDNVLLPEGGWSKRSAPQNVAAECGGPHRLARRWTGIFYAQGVKANVIFFLIASPARAKSPGTKKVWFMAELRNTNKDFISKTARLWHAPDLGRVRVHPATTPETIETTAQASHPGREKT